ncbi:uncharacterized protein C9orf40 homolog [Neophocaena asiaeorientalis asiaeorientalis]|uniref:Uncharacterized protein C9orf40 homolog n=1 Tax=Neophocaena asiaeorientalis asiaeorientalis TaxID=1706337 RepID=A0A341AZF4_NEOAA|nr:uncharacterized protein C9orf40 homolog [Neophocaena asiaeorientalis asiaeorientalis]
MAKRRAAEPLTFHVPWKRLLLCDFPEEPPRPPLWIPPPGASHPEQPLGVPELPRKRKIDAGGMTEPLVSPSKRRDGGDTGAPDGAEREGRGRGTSEPPLLQPPACLCYQNILTAVCHKLIRGTWKWQLNEEFWQYNTFQYWRNPLPPIDLADIEDVSEDNLTETTLQDKNEVVEIDMES